MPRISKYSTCLRLMEDRFDPRTGTSCSLGRGLAQIRFNYLSPELFPKKAWDFGRAFGNRNMRLL